MTQPAKLSITLKNGNLLPTTLNTQNKHNEIIESKYKSFPIPYQKIAVVNERADILLDCVSRFDSDSKKESENELDDERKIILFYNFLSFS